MPEHSLFDENDLIDLEDELTEQRDDRVSPWILSAAIVGLVIGFFLWGSLAMSVASSAADFLDGLDTTTQGAPAAIDTVAPAASATGEPTATPTPDATINRLDCDAIRGTDYRSPEERSWFLANCVTR